MKPWEVRNAAARKAWVARGRRSRKFDADQGFTFSAPPPGFGVSPLSAIYAEVGRSLLIADMLRTRP